MCVHNKEILHNFKQLILCHLNNNTLKNETSNKENQAAISGLKSFTTMTKQDLETMLVKGNQQFTKEVITNLNKEACASLTSTAIRAGVGFIPYAGGAIAGSLSIANTGNIAFNIIETNKFKDKTKIYSLAGLAVSGVILNVSIEVGQAVGKSIGSGAAEAALELIGGTLYYQEFLLQ